jgi:hypothetical protein
MPPPPPRPHPRPWPKKLRPPDSKPDERKAEMATTKTSLSSILRDPAHQDLILGAVLRVHELMCAGTQFLKAFYLYKAEDKQDLPPYTTPLLKAAIKVVRSWPACRPLSPLS